MFLNKSVWQQMLEDYEEEKELHPLPEDIEGNFNLSDYDLSTIS